MTDEELTRLEGAHQMYDPIRLNDIERTFFAYEYKKAVLALIAEVRRLRTEVAELNARWRTETERQYNDGVERSLSDD